MSFSIFEHMRISILAISILLLFGAGKPIGVVYKTSKANIKFKSEAPMELIRAESKKLVGLLNTEKNSYAFQVAVISFQGFNSELQREHFNENYMESTKFPKIKFVGKIIEPLNYSGSFDKEVNLKGNMTIHGISKPVNLKARMKKTGSTIAAVSKFEVTLSDYNIKIPTIVNQKLAKVISIEVNTVLQPKQ